MIRFDPELRAMKLRIAADLRSQAADLHREAQAKENMAEVIERTWAETPEPSAFDLQGHTHPAAVAFDTQCPACLPQRCTGRGGAHGGHIIHDEPCPVHPEPAVNTTIRNSPMQPETLDRHGKTQ